MRYLLPLIEGYLVRRIRRFLADVTVEGRLLTVHCPNSGSMAGLLDSGNRVRISGPYLGTRKYAYTLEQIQITRPDGRKIWVGINTMVPNLLVHEILKARRLPELKNYSTIGKEVKLGDHSRIDFRCEGVGLSPCWIEVKNVTSLLLDPTRKSHLNEGNIAVFPDSVTTRGAKHLHELMGRVALRERAMMLYVIQRSDAELFSPAPCCDPNYTKELLRAQTAGVEVLAIRARITKSGIFFGKKIQSIA